MSKRVLKPWSADNNNMDTVVSNPSAGSGADSGNPPIKIRLTRNLGNIQKAGTQLPVDDTASSLAEMDDQASAAVINPASKKKNKNIDEGHPGGLMIGSVIILL